MVVCRFLADGKYGADNKTAAETEEEAEPAFRVVDRKPSEQIGQKSGQKNHGCYHENRAQRHRAFLEESICEKKKAQQSNAGRTVRLPAW